jgi:hypothetical protein
MKTHPSPETSYPVYATLPVQGLARLRAGGRFTPFVLPLIATLAISVLLGAAASSSPRLDDEGYGVRPAHVLSCEGDRIDPACKMPVV